MLTVVSLPGDQGLQDQGLPGCLSLLGFCLVFAAGVLEIGRDECVNGHTMPGWQNRWPSALVPLTVTGFPPLLPLPP